MTASIPRDDLVAVIGLGRFGGRAALTLARLGRQVLGIDRDASTVNRFTGQLPRALGMLALFAAAFRWDRRRDRLRTEAATLSAIPRQRP